MRRLLTILLWMAFSFAAKADHITGGEMYYTYAGTINGEHQYSVTLKLFMRCNSGRQFPNPIIVSIFDRFDLKRVEDRNIALSNQRTLQLVNPDPCITNPPDVCYEVAYYNFNISVKQNAAGYMLAAQVNYRINGISNLDGSTQIGAMYTCEIPGTVESTGAHKNKSAVFTGNDLVIVCAGNYFSYSFAARDDDGDELRYAFCAAYRSSSFGVNNDPPGDPPYSPVPYGLPKYSEAIPLGNRVTVDPATGVITGVAPPEGQYVVTVCVSELRNGTVIATQRKDVQINVADCSVAGALLEEDYMLCGNTRTLTANNLSNSPLIHAYDWSVFTPGGVEIFTSKNNTLKYDFAVNGKYTIQLIVNRGAPCSDTTTAPVLVYPGLNPDFTTAGICISKPTVFTDQTTLLSGSINSWNWDFGESSSIADISSQRNPAYTYPTEGAKNAQLTVTTTDGCEGTVSKRVDVVHKPPITLAFRDTIICQNDLLQLQASGTGNFLWSPAAGMNNAAINNPFVSPAVSTRYYVDLNTDGCINRDSVNVNVVNRVNLQVMNDTTICSGDTIQLRVDSDALKFAWEPVNQLTDPATQNPIAITSTFTSYQVRATIGGCTATDNIIVRTIPYPIANAGIDTVICYNTKAQLQAFTNGTSWQWTPASSLSDANSLGPIAGPVNSVNYVFTVTDNESGCPKPARDTITVTVLPEINAFAGNDTTVVIGQPVQFNASGGDAYAWSPGIALSSTAIANPVAVFTEPSNGIRYQVDVYNSIGCHDSAFMVVKIFATPPTVFVPNAFTPNNDGNNDVLRPIVAGMKHFDYFNIYNRWGQLVFSTSTDGHGWNGTINGEPQTSNTYVWVVKAVDFNGAPYLKKGTVTLIR